jgi:hypothetical protein
MTMTSSLSLDCGKRSSSSNTEPPPLADAESFQSNDITPYPIQEKTISLILVTTRKARPPFSQPLWPGRWKR